MNNLKKISMLLIMISVIIISCKKEEENPINKTTLIVHTGVDEGNGPVIKQDVTVHLRKQEVNRPGNEIKQLSTNAQGIVTFEELSPDTYNIFCEWGHYASNEENIVIQKDEERSVNTTLTYAPTK